MQGAVRLGARAARALPLFLSKPNEGRAKVPLFGTGDRMCWCIAARRYEVDGVAVFALCRGGGNASLEHLGISQSHARLLLRDAARLLGLRVLCEWAF